MALEVVGDIELFAQGRGRPCHRHHGHERQEHGHDAWWASMARARRHSRAASAAIWVRQRWTCWAVQAHAALRAGAVEFPARYDVESRSRWPRLCSTSRRITWTVTAGHRGLRAVQGPHLQAVWYCGRQSGRSLRCGNVYSGQSARWLLAAPGSRRIHTAGRRGWRSGAGQERRAFVATVADAPEWPAQCCQCARSAGVRCRGKPADDGDAAGTAELRRIAASLPVGCRRRRSPLRQRLERHERRRDAGRRAGHARHTGAHRRW